MLGKDNSPSPQPLKPLQGAHHLIEKWSVPSPTAKTKGYTFLKLKPVIINKTVYIAHASGLVEAVNSIDGKLLWNKRLPVGLMSGPSIKDGYLIVTSDASTVIALNAANGQELWQTNVSGDVLAKPLITHNKAIIKTVDGHVYGLQLKTGHPEWVLDHGAPNLILKASSAPAIVNDTLLIGYSDGKLEAVNVQDGQVLWQKSITYAVGASDVERLIDIDADPIVQGNIIYLANYQGFIGAVSMQTGDFIWKKPASTFTNIIIKNNTIYMTDAENTIWSINKQDGRVNWKQTQLQYRGVTEPVLLNNSLVVGDKTGLLHVLSTQSGEFIARLEVGAPISMAPETANDQIYVMADNGYLSCFYVR